ncbi:MAG: RNA polymerase subunit sigma-70 [Actinobacteria bacterium HGW-Actinobacteria-5]|jgi:DNA-binding transcriptional regulator LsrR (DeoR family)|nr:MAG: RNA polymerase subunit sigma-70 [Actinobacteria bacterium HGW-Actinobacteria-5]
MRFPADMLYRGARLYYEEDRNQQEISELLGISRATVSRLLAEARACGVVHIEVRDPAAGELETLAAALKDHLGLLRVVVTPNVLGALPAAVQAPAVAKLLDEAGLHAGDALLVSPGATILGLAHERLVPLPGVFVAPTIAGMDEPEEFYQANEITRLLALNAGATPVLLHAPVQPAEALYGLLQEDPGVKRVTGLWRQAKCALLDIGEPPRVRSSLPTVLRRVIADLRTAEAEISNRTFDEHGAPVPYPGSDRVISMPLDDLLRVPHAIGVAVGTNKAKGITAAARAGYINRLVTDTATAHAILELAR